MDRKRLTMLAAAAAVAIVAVVVIVLVAGNGGGSSTSAQTTTTTSGGGGSTSTGGTDTTPASQSAFAGVPQHGDTLGKASAPATLTVFEDPQCPYCRQWNIDTLPTVVDRYVRTGRVKLVYHGIVIIGENSVAGLRAVYAAGAQNHLWNMSEALYEQQGEENSGWITIPLIRSTAKSLGLNAARLIADADSKAVTAKLNASAATADANGISSTPTFAIQKQLGPFEQLQVAGLDPDQFLPALDAALK